jgi:hypothetical protein
METDIMETDDPRKLYTVNQRTKVFGPIMLPPLKENSETTSYVEITQPQSGDDERENERKKNRNKRRIQQRNKRVIIAYFYSLY